MFTINLINHEENFLQISNVAVRTTVFKEPVKIWDRERSFSRLLLSNKKFKPTQIKNFAKTLLNT